MGKDIGCLTNEERSEIVNLFFKESPLSPEDITIHSPGGYFGGPNSMSQERQDSYYSLLDCL